MRIHYFLIVLFMVPLAGWYRCDKKKCVPVSCCKQHKSIVHAAGYFLGEIVIDILSVQRYLFSLDTVKILTGFTPFYLIARRLDDDIQSRFYDPCTHKNVNQFPSSCHTVAKVGVGIPMAGLSSLAIFGWNPDIRMTGRIFALTIPFVHWTKDLIKTLEAKPCLRPWHEDFSCEKRSPGGFPSGHMANITFAAALFGMRYGLAWGVPLGLFATFVFADFINCNRHYFSQLLAGSAFGLIYAFAANKVIEKKLHEQFSFSCGVNPNKQAWIKVSGTF